VEIECRGEIISGLLMAGLECLIINPFRNSHIFADKYMGGFIKEGFYEGRTKEGLRQREK
jgi:hypothetical protein